MFWNNKEIKLFNKNNNLIISEVKMTEKGVGSLWNVNSWHWQMKNYTELAQKILTEKFKNYNLKYQSSFNKAEAEVNIRKGKQVLLYDFELEVDVKGHNQEQESKGSYRAKEILSDDLNDIVIDDVKATQKNKVADQMKKWLKKNAKQHVINAFKDLQTQLMKIQSDPNKLQEDKKKRQEAQTATQKAKEQKGLEKERLLQQQKQQERKMKEQAHRKNFQKKQQPKPK